MIPRSLNWSGVSWEMQEMLIQITESFLTVQPCQITLSILFGTGGTGTGVTGTGGTVPDEPPASPVDPGSQSQRGHAAEPRKQAQH